MRVNLDVKLGGEKLSSRLHMLLAFDKKLVGESTTQRYSKLEFSFIGYYGSPHCWFLWQKKHASLQTSHFLSSCAALGILILSGIVLLLVLLPVAATDNNLKLSANSSTSNGTFNDLDKLSMGNVKVSYATFVINYKQFSFLVFPLWKMVNMWLRWLKIEITIKSIFLEIVTSFFLLWHIKIP